MVGDIGAGAEPDIRLVVRTGIELRSAGPGRVCSLPYAALPTRRQRPGSKRPSPGEALHGGAVLALGFRLGAAGLLLRLKYNTLSNLAGGYPDDVAGRVEYVSGWSLKD